MFRVGKVRSLARGLIGRGLHAAKWRGGALSFAAIWVLSGVMPDHPGTIVVVAIFVESLYGTHSGEKMLHGRCHVLS